jgi:hypothetical protein
MHLEVLGITPKRLGANAKPRAVGFPNMMKAGEDEGRLTAPYGQQQPAKAKTDIAGNAASLIIQGPMRLMAHGGRLGLRSPAVGGRVRGKQLKIA